MQKAIGMGIIALALWTAIELFTEGPAGAFDGAFGAAAIDRLTGE
jgi:hypothetical protein